MGKRAKIIYSPSATQDLQEILEYYTDKGSPETGRRLIHDVLEHIEQLAQFPEIGRIVPEFETPWLRELIHPPFRIVYRKQERSVQIVRVWRSERLLKFPGN